MTIARLERRLLECLSCRHSGQSEPARTRDARRRLFERLSCRHFGQNGPARTRDVLSRRTSRSDQQTYCLQCETFVNRALDEGLTELSIEHLCLPDLSFGFASPFHKQKRFHCRKTLQKHIWPGRTLSTQAAHTRWRKSESKVPPCDVLDAFT